MNADYTWQDLVLATLIALLVILILWRLGVVTILLNSPMFNSCSIPANWHCTPGCPNYTGGYCPSY